MTMPHKTYRNQEFIEVHNPIVSSNMKILQLLEDTAFLMKNYRLFV